MQYLQRNSLGTALGYIFWTKGDRNPGNQHTYGWKGRRDSKSFVVVDEDCGIPISIIEDNSAYPDTGESARSDPRSLLLSMSEYGKPQSYVYDYPPTRPEQGSHEFSYGAHQNFAGPFAGTQAQVPSGLPQVPLMPPAQQYGTHDQTYFDQRQNSQFSTYVPAGPRQLPVITSYMPTQGHAGTKVTITFRSLYDFNDPPVTAYIMFGHKRCESRLSKSLLNQSTNFHEYTLSTLVPPVGSTGSVSPTPLHLVLDNTTVNWESPWLEFGNFTYLDSPAFYPSHSPERALRKRKISSEASPRQSPVKKAPYQHFPHRNDHASLPLNVGQAVAPIPEFRRPSLQDVPARNRRFSSDYRQTYDVPVSTALTTPFYGLSTEQSAPLLQSQSNPPWAYRSAAQSVSRRPSTSVTVGESSNQVFASPATTAPPLIRTSIMQNSPTASTNVAPSAGFNPYAIYPANAKASLKIEGDLNSMSDKWTATELNARRRLVQFRRVQTGSVISATFEPVTLESRLPNSICVSCIYWAEKKACYVTSVDTISLLESLVAVRFTVEEKNRIRRNLEGFRPATVSKAKPDSEDFFKLIMGFPNPKPRNIEKDVKSASYSSTAGMLHTPVASTSAYTTFGDRSQSTGTSPRSGPGALPTAYGQMHVPQPMTAKEYSSHAVASAGLGIGPSAGQPDLRLAVPITAAGQATSWHPTATQFVSNLATSSAGASWDFAYMSPSPLTGLPPSTQAYQLSQPQRYATSMAGQALQSDTRFIPLHEYEDQSHQQTTTR
nr:hypothetical protein CFP56_16901 [Quercus suber]